MIWIKSSLFILTIVTVKFIFKFINDYGDRRMDNMKELLDFTDYLRIYSCQMHMSYEEIYLKYNFSNENIRMVCNKLMDEIENKKNKSKYIDYIEELLHTPDNFNKKFIDILDYYGSTYSDVLDAKLKFTIREMEYSMKDYERQHIDKKNLNNRISLLLGCLAAVILI
ncbi:hypothetical protein [Sedimentibacter sp.]|uniref:hypothetical protein n=1 Tax=Sedimentibacter sp. TaxID=1960295 RepID=UPI00289686E4|nr:hypothetical protein [Sedimentibacter sp.]